MIILTTLGLGRKDATDHYETVLYEWIDREGNRHETTTSLFPLALAEWFPNSHLIVLLTADVKKQRGTELLAALPTAQLIDIPNGANDDEFWQMFNVIAEAIPEGEEVILDITHGFRSIPMLGLLSLSFLRVAKKVTIKHILYGARDANPGKSPVPVFDLAPFLTMLDWANATDRFLETGDARKISPLIEEKHKNPLNSVARKMTELSQALLLARADEVLVRARELQEKIAIAKTETWEPQHSPLKLLLDDVATRFAPAAHSDILTAQWEQIRWFIAHGHYNSAASLAREWLVSLRVQLDGGTLRPVVNEQRKVAENWLNNRDKEVPEDWDAVQKLWVNVSDLRNDLMHFGMREQPRPAKAILEQVQALPEQLRQAALPLGIAVGEEVGE
jgi:CRISPR-associated DxTHG motif protein